MRGAGDCAEVYPVWCQSVARTNDRESAQGGSEMPVIKLAVHGVDDVEVIDACHACVVSSCLCSCLMFFIFLFVSVFFFFSPSFRTAVRALVFIAGRVPPVPFPLLTLGSNFVPGIVHVRNKRGSSGRMVREADEINRV